MATGTKPQRDAPGGEWQGDALWADCPGCPKCLPNGGLVLRKGSWRPTEAHSYILMLAKSASYFADGEAVRLPWNEATIERAQHTFGYGGRSQLVVDEGLYRRSIQRANEETAERVRSGQGGPNLRSIWRIPSEPSSLSVYDFDSADYVGADGKPYKWSANCPVHLKPPASKKKRKAFYDAPLDFQSPGKDDSGDDPVQEPLFEGAAKPQCNDCSPMQPATSGLHNAENIAENKTSVSRQVDAQRGVGNIDRPSVSSSKLGLQSQLSSPFAIPHNIQSHKTAPAHETNPACKPSAEKADGIEHIQELPLFSGQHPDIDGSNTSGDALPGEKGQYPSAETEFGIADKAHSKSICTCSISQVGHFATFPTALPEKCILAGTSEWGNCPRCGMPWAPVIKIGDLVPDAPGYKPRGSNHPEAGVKTALTPAGETQGHPNFHYDSSIIGWRPACSCGLVERVPAVVLDPFTGTSSAGVAAQRLGRKFIGIDLSEPYLQLSIKRLEAVNLPLGL